MSRSPSLGRALHEGENNLSTEQLSLSKKIELSNKENNRLEQRIIQHLSSQSMAIQVSNKSNEKVSEHFQVMYSNALKSIQETTISIKDIQINSENLARKLQGQCDEKQRTEKDIWNAFCDFRKQVFMDARDSKKAKALKLRRLEELESQEEEVGMIEKYIESYIESDYSTLISRKISNYCLSTETKSHCIVPTQCPENQAQSQTSREKTRFS